MKNGFIPLKYTVAMNYGPSIWKVAYQTDSMNFVKKQTFVNSCNLQAENLKWMSN